MLQSVLSGYCLCFTHMLQAYVLNVLVVSDVCCIRCCMFEAYTLGWDSRSHVARIRRWRRMDSRVRTWNGAGTGGPACTQETEGRGRSRVRTVNGVCECPGASSTVMSTSNLFRTWENQPNHVEIYVRVSIGQSGGGRRWERIRSKNVVTKANV
jgi:hypothetical protein